MAKENFFDFREKQTAKPAPAPAKSEPLTVSQLTSQIDQALKGAFPRTVYVKGEVSNLNLHRGSGHLYFTLKDLGACIDCVMFRSDAARLGNVTLQIVRDWVLQFNANGPTGLVDGKAPGPRSWLNDAQRAALGKGY